MFGHHPNANNNNNAAQNQVANQQPVAGAPQNQAGENEQPEAKPSVTPSIRSR